VIFCVFGTTASAGVITATASLDGFQEVPPIITSAFGSATVLLDTDTALLSISMSVSGIDLGDLAHFPGIGPVHLHLGAAGLNGPIVLPFGPAVAPAFTATASGFDLNVTGLDTSGLANFGSDLQAGNIYINVHTNSFVSGEIRGQLSVPEPASIALMAPGIAGIGYSRKRKSA
jgi:hypothetical protein